MGRSLATLTSKSRLAWSDEQVKTLDNLLREDFKWQKLYSSCIFEGKEFTPRLVRELIFDDKYIQDAYWNAIGCHELYQQRFEHVRGVVNSKIFQKLWTTMEAILNKPHDPDPNNPRFRDTASTSSPASTGSTKKPTPQKFGSEPDPDQLRKRLADLSRQMGGGIYASNYFQAAANGCIVSKDRKCQSPLRDPQGDIGIQLGTKRDSESER